MHTLIKILIGVLYGLLTTVLAIPLSKKLILSRSDDPGDILPLKNKINMIIILVAGLAGSLGVSLTAPDVPLMVRNLLLLIPMLSISIVDLIIRKIPNPLLLVMIIIQGCYAAYYCITNHSTSYLIQIAFGFGIGFIGCTIPSILKIPVGAGDIKYSAVIGLIVLITGYFQSMIIMGIAAIAAFIVLKVTKKGGMKTMIPMGPFLSVGSVITICWPLLDSLVGELGYFN